MFVREVEYENKNGDHIEKMRDEMKAGFDIIMRNQNRNKEQLDEIIRLLKMDKKLPTSSFEIAANLDKPSWDAWLQLKRHLFNLDTISAQYILLVDKFPDPDLEYYGVFSEIPWNLVLDIDPDSEMDGGFMGLEKANSGRSNIIETHTSVSIKEHRMHLERSLDSKRTQWVYANGRNNDKKECAPKESLSDWKRKFAFQIGTFLECLALKLDPLKPTICVILPMRQNSLPFAKDLLERVNQCFSSNDYKMTYVSVNCDPLYDHLKSEEFHQKYHSFLSPEYLFLGIRQLLGHKQGDYLMPTAQKDILKPLPIETYRFVTEYLDILYKGRENIPERDEWSDEELEEFKREHLESFVSGNTISFESLAFGHDARRQQTTEVFGHITSLLSGYLAKAVIVEIVHSPGSGGTTIARRVIWDLHMTYPCAVVDINEIASKIELDLDSSVSGVAERIWELEDACRAPPVILVHGNSSIIESFSEYLVRKLRSFGTKTVILRCIRGSKKRADDVDPNVNRTFQVEKLEDKSADREAFENMYASFQKDQNKLKASRRVFHFPLLVMMGRFQDNLKRIITDSMESIKRASPVEYEVAILVAFIQIYAGRGTPALLIKKAFHEQILKLTRGEDVTYNDIANHFSNDLVNLMVREKPATRRQWSTRRSYPPNTRDQYADTKRMIERYTFQHDVVADLVLKFSDRNVGQITEGFLGYPIFDLRSAEGHQLKSIFNQLFFYHQREKPMESSLLVKRLERESHDVARDTLYQLAENTRDPIHYCNVAKYISKEEHDFDAAMKLINKAFAIDEEISHDKTKKIHEFHGNVLLSEFKRKRENIKDFEELEAMANEVLVAYKKARDYPLSKPFPLLGEVRVWVECYNWIFKKYNGNVEDGMRCIMSDRCFFLTSLGDCYHLLDKSDRLLNSRVDVTGVEYSRKEINNLRLELIRFFGPSGGKSRRQSCENLASSPHLKNADPKELLRLKLALFFKFYDKDSELSIADRKYALYILEQLVQTYKDYNYANSLLRIARLPNVANYTIDRALQIVSPWCASFPSDPQASFYMYVLSFLKLLNGDDVIEYKSKYELALEECSRESKNNNLRRYAQQFFLSSERKDNNDRLSQLITGQELHLKEREVKGNPSENDKNGISGEQSFQFDDKFWRRDSRKYLLECSGRIYTKLEGREEQPYISFTRGGMNIHVSKNVVGKAGKDYQIGALVYFVVGFSLAGPRSNGVSFTPFQQISKK